MNEWRSRDSSAKLWLAGRIFRTRIGIQDLIFYSHTHVLGLVGIFFLWKDLYHLREK